MTNVDWREVTNDVMREWARQLPEGLVLVAFPGGHRARVVTSVIAGESTGGYDVALNSFWLEDEDAEYHPLHGMLYAIVCIAQ